MNHHQLVHHIRQEAKECMEASQVLKRLEELLPSRLKELQKELQKKHSLDSGYTKAMRRALQDVKYLQYLNEIDKIRRKYLEHRHQWEYLVMLAKARQSLNSYNRLLLKLR